MKQGLVILFSILSLNAFGATELILYPDLSNIPLKDQINYFPTRGQLSSATIYQGALLLNGFDEDGFSCQISQAVAANSGLTLGELFMIAKSNTTTTVTIGCQTNIDPRNSPVRYVDATSLTIY